MPSRKSVIPVLAALIAALAAAPALADDMNFTDPLTGPSSPHLEIHEKYAYSPEGLRRVDGDCVFGWPVVPPHRTCDYSIDRPVNRTVSGGFLDHDFVAELRVRRQSGVFDIMYFGFGEGVPRAYNEPSNAFVFRIHNTGHQVDAVWNKEWAMFNAAPGEPSIRLGTFDGDMTFRIEKTDSDVVLSIPETGASFTFPVSLLADVLTPSNGYIFFGNGTVGDGSTGSIFSDLSVETIGANTPPDVSDAAPSDGSLWPPNNKMVDIDILGVTDLDEDDDVTIVITAITNDETGEADADGIGTSTAQVRAARDGSGDGRSYTITFEASDGTDTVEGSVTVTVAHDQGNGRGRGRSKAAGMAVSSWAEVKRSVQ